MSNMSPKAASKELNYVTMVAEEQIRELAVPLEVFINQVLAQSGIPTRSDFDALSRKIDELSAKLARS